MKKKGGAAKKRQSVADLLMTPPQGGTTKTSNRSSESPKSFKFKLNSPAKKSGSGKRRQSVTPPVKSSSRRRRTSVADLLVTPPQGGIKTSDRSSESPKSFKFKLNSPAKSSGSGKLRKPVASPVKSPSHRRTEAMSSISELKELTSSRLDSIKRQVDHSYSDMFKDIDSFYSRLHKHFKIQTQVCQQFMDDIEKEFKKMSERIVESSEAMNVSYAEFTVEAEDTGSHGCKTSVPEEEQSFEKKFGALRSHYGIFSMSP